MKKIDFTIAVAIYKVEAYLKECIDSIAGQLDDSMELILVDDGSPDGCGEICDRYAQSDDRIKVIHQKNGGLSAARNTAIEAASGKWLVFVDGDDRITGNAMAAMKKYSEDTAQLIIFDYIEFDSNGEWNRCLPHGNFVMDTPEMLEQFRASTMYLQPTLANKFIGGQCVTSWGKMWKVSYIRENGYTFSTAVRRGEDNLFSFFASRRMTRVRVCDDCVYEYRQNGGGIMQRFEPKTPEHYRTLLSIIKKDMEDHGETDNPILYKGYIELSLDGLAYSLRQNIMHRDCHWSRKERLEWLNSLADESWINEAMMYSPSSDLPRLTLNRMKKTVYNWMKKRAYRRIDFSCRAYRLLTLAKKSTSKGKP